MPQVDEARCATSATRSRTSLVGNEIFQSRTRGIGIIPRELGAAVRRCRAPTCARRASTGTSAATAQPYLVVRRARLEGLDPPRRRLVRPLLGAAAGDARVDARSSTAAARRPAGRPDHGQGAPHHQGARGRGLGRAPRTRSARWATTSSRKGDLGPFRVKIRSAVVQQRLDPAVAAARRVRPRRHHDPREPLLHPRGHRPMTLRCSQLDVVLGHDARAQDVVVVLASCRWRAHPRLRLPASR